MAQKKMLSTDDLENPPTEDEGAKAPTSEYVFDHNADADAHHSEEIAEGRFKSATATLLSLPGVGGFSMGTKAFTKDNIFYFPIYVRTPITIDQVTIEVTAAAGAGEKCYVAIYAADVDWQPGARQVLSAEIAIDAIAVVDTAVTETTLQEGRYLIAITLEGTATLRITAYSSWPGSYKATTNIFQPVRELTIAAGYAALPNPGTDWDTIVYTNYGFQYGVALRVKTP